MRKTWFSYLEWMSFVIITAAFAAAYLPAASAALLRGNQYTAVSLVFLAAVLAVVCWFAGQKTAGIFGRKGVEKCAFPTGFGNFFSGMFIGGICCLPDAVIKRTWCTKGQYIL